MKIKVFGTGAAGNKAAIELIEGEILTSEDVMLINSTKRDLPVSYREKAVCISENGGCGKERDLSKNLTLSSIREGSLQNIEQFIEEDDEAAIIVHSTEGGTGCGSAPIIGKFLKQVVGIPVLYFGFSGFEEDGRGLQNTIEYFQELDQDDIIQIISNKKFLEEANNNKIKAEKLANKEFAKRVSVLIAQGCVDSEQNIDETDLFKVVTTEGYQTCGKIALEKIKDVATFNKVVTEMINSDKSLDISKKSTKRLAVFINAKEETLDYIDYSYSVLKEKLGVPYEVFQHIQSEPDQEESISFIASGMKMPIEEVEDIYTKYKEQSEKVDKKEDKFYSTLNELEGNKEDSMFNAGAKRRRKPNSKADFMGSFEKKPEPVTEEKKGTMSKEDYLKSNF